MKKDERLEKIFDEYFEGAAPPKGATDDAKNLIARKKRTRRVWWSVASAAACALLVFAGAAGVFLNDFALGPSDTDLPAAPSDGQDESNGYAYTSDELTGERISAYEAAKLPALSFLERFLYATNADVAACTQYTKDGQTALVEAQICVVTATGRQDVTVYAEYDGGVYAELADFYDGAERNYGGLSYVYSRTEEDGEYVSAIATAYGGAKVYFSVKSADPNAYVYYLDILAA